MVRAMSNANITTVVRIQVDKIVPCNHRENNIERFCFQKAKLKSSMITSNSTPANVARKITI